MIYLIIGMSLLFIAVGFIVNERNAKYLLSGYNTMSEEDRKQVDLKAFIPYFRNFHIFLGLTFLILGTALTLLVGKNAGGIFLATYPILAYIYFIITSAKYSKGLGPKLNNISVVILIATLLIVVGLLGFGFMENKFSYDSNEVKIAGIYGEIITQDEIQYVTLLNEMPEITLKTNGFALGTIHKGYFRTKSGEIVKLILNSNNKPLILITKTDGKEVYFSAKDKSNEDLFNEMKESLPNILYK